MKIHPHTPLHLPDYQTPTHEILAELKQQGDPEADAVIKFLFTNQQAKVLNQLMQALQLNRDLTNHPLPTEVNAFVEHAGQIPTWANDDLLAQANRFFTQYAHQFTSMLSFLSLPYTYAAAHGVQVLYLTKRMHHDVTRRLHETARFLLDVTAPNAFAPEGKGIVSSLKVRLMHAAVRYHLAKRPQWKAEWGVPINQEEMIGTSLSFSVLPVLGLQKMGNHLNQRDMTAYLHLWKVVGAFLGNEVLYLPNRYKEGSQLETLIRQRNFAPSSEGKTLTQALIQSLEESLGKRFPKGFVTAYMRFLLGDELANMVGVPPYNWTRALVSTFRASNVLKALSPTPSTAGQEFLQQMQYFLKKDPVEFKIPLVV
ncbi:oxygenase MpaB family protein [Microscilla marina]|uniref:ER-bound oxygenase mpaB/mpaB'/Rubber oxygenase catalytic domain-containing protein n=1 Tax=Microscilla marina ATCC 23134 TaxID=313606 RepID=A1ZSU6_MICM2|nr:oxygenase MpaB family protein [Microscilla marina]EAY26510.1 conserved hypothetical protein [Microscilla marina ATCC 23134]